VRALVPQLLSKIAQLEQQVAHYTRMLFGKKSEKTRYLDPNGLLPFPEFAELRGEVRPRSRRPRRDGEPQPDGGGDRDSWQSQCSRLVPISLVGSATSPPSSIGGLPSASCARTGSRAFLMRSIVLSPLSVRRCGGVGPLPREPTERGTAARWTDGE